MEKEDSDIAELYNKTRKRYENDNENVKKIVYILLALIALTGCKKNEWLDWKAENDAWFASHDTYTFTYNYVDSITGDTCVGKKVFPMQTTDLGVKYCVLADPNPTGARPSASSYVTIQYEGWLINGLSFTTYDFNHNYTTQEMSYFVTGFADGLKRIHVDGDVVMYIPYELGYGYSPVGTEGYTSFIPPYSVLIYRVHLCSIE